MSALRARASRLGVLLLLAGALLPPLARAAQRRPTSPAPAVETRVAADGGTPAVPAPRRADSVAPARPPAAGPRSQAGPALTQGAGSSGGDEAAASAEATVGEADPLVSNGLGSPSCRGGFGAGELPSGVRGNCETSGFAAAAAPTGNFGVDVHIDTGVLGLSSGGLLASVQDLCVTPLWMALVWAVHALVVMLEWCFTIDLLDSASVQLGVARGLRQAQAAFTVPWLATVLAVGAVVLAYDGLVRRQVAESLGRALLALAMTAGGLWLMIDPAGTIGALGGWANQASLGTLAVSARGTPAQPGATLDGAMRTVFAAVVEGPWCYLEFGNVGWCRDPRRLDPRLRSAALALATEESTQIDCGASAPAAGCAPHESVDARALAHSARLLRAARTNGAIFLALPANGAGRNSINDSRSLLRAICQSEDATRCRGPSASEAEFRTNHGTWPRVGGLLLIVAGAVGMLLLLGFLAMRLLTAALFSLLYLLMAPLVSLAPALGESGRTLFRKWGMRLVAAVASKLLFSFVLGAILAVLGILADLEALGWWTQWLLMSAFWWAAFMHRDQALQLASGRSDRQQAGPRRRTIVRQLGAYGPRRRIAERVQTARERRRRHAADDSAATARREGSARERVESGRSRRPAEAPGAFPEPQARRVIDAEERDAGVRRAAIATGETRVATLGGRLTRIRHEAAVASKSGDRRRALRLTSRGERVEAEAREARAELDRARGPKADDRGGSPSQGRSGLEHERARFLDAQSKLPAAVDAHRARAAIRRDYVALAGLVGQGAREYERLAPREQRAARLTIDRELAIRRERLLTGEGVDRSRSSLRAQSPSEETSGREVARLAEPARGRDGRPVPWRAPESRRPESNGASESTVMQDARAVAERRKRQLGIGQP